jgi:hypothetical protein
MTGIGWVGAALCGTNRWTAGFMRSLCTQKPHQSIAVSRAKLSTMVTYSQVSTNPMMTSYNRAHPQARRELLPSDE